MSSIPSPKSHLQVSASDPYLPLTSRKQTVENSARPASECVQGNAGSATAADHGLVNAPTRHREKPQGEQRRGETPAVVRMSQWLKRRKKRLDVLIYGADREQNTVAGVQVRRVDLLGGAAAPPPAASGTLPSPPASATSGAASPSPSSKSKPPPSGAPVTVFTATSRRAFRYAVLAIEHLLMPQKRGKRWHFTASFITLTYSTKHRPTPEKWKRDRDAWLKRLRRRYPDAVPIWVREYTKAGVVHFHLLVWWGVARYTESWKDRRAWISRSWAETITDGAKDKEAYLASLKAGTNCRPVTSKGKLREYLGKGGGEKAHPGSSMVRELGKRAQKSAPVEGEGRWWGLGNRAAYNRAKRIYIVILTVRDAARLAVAIRKCWLEYLRRLGIVIDPDTRVPQWVAGRIADELLQAEGPA